jgi:hypothetical protein
MGVDYKACAGYGFILNAREVTSLHNHYQNCEAEDGLEDWLSEKLGMNIVWPSAMNEQTIFIGLASASRSRVDCEEGHWFRLADTHENNRVEFVDTITKFFKDNYDLTILPGRFGMFVGGYAS